MGMYGDGDPYISMYRLVQIDEWPSALVPCRYMTLNIRHYFLVTALGCRW
jgi:hypothetical protein